MVITAVNIPVEAKHNGDKKTVKATDQSKVISKLIFNSIIFDPTVKGVLPNFKCPMCGSFWQPKLDLKDAEKVVEYDFNGLVSFLVPDHQNKKEYCSLGGQTIELFMAIHKDENGMQVCIQKSIDEGTGGIPANWWVRL